MTYPQGTTQGLCSSASTGFAICVAFLGAWGFSNDNPWEKVHLIVLVPVVLAALGFGLTPFIATRTTPTPEKCARRLYLGAVLCAVFAVTAALVIGYVVA